MPSDSTRVKSADARHFSTLLLGGAVLVGMLAIARAAPATPVSRPAVNGDIGAAVEASSSIPDTLDTTFSRMSAAQSGLTSAITKDEAVAAAVRAGAPIGTDPIVELLQVTVSQRGAAVQSDTRWVIYSTDALVPLLGPVGNRGGSAMARSWVYVSPAGEFMGYVSGP
jgi:hypothetical protein